MFYFPKMHKKQGNFERFFEYCGIAHNFALLPVLFMTAISYFLEDIIDDSLPMQTLQPAVFDRLLSQGWRVLGHQLLRHSFASHDGVLCRTIPLRIDLERFYLSKRQKTLMRRHQAQLDVQYGPIQPNAHVVELFHRHAERFDALRPKQFGSFIGERAQVEPVPGMQLSVREGDNAPLAYSFIHLGQTAVSGTYCIFEPGCTRFSPGIFTLLLEIEKARDLGKRYYYHGYVYDVPSSYGYKLQFHGLEAMDWKSGLWHPMDRQVNTP